jgi:ATP-dependent RNA helicase DeaD
MKQGHSQSGNDADRGFATLGLAAKLLAAVTALGYEEPTPIQREAIPLLLAGRDLLGQAATGTGKTAAFALPMIQRVVENRGSAKSVAGLVLVPTRELAMQVSEAVHRYGRAFGLHVVPVYGGASMQQQIRALDHGAPIVVATPGRALDLINRKALKLQNIQVLVLDEADEMLDMGFAEDLDAILQATPRERQTALFSATMPARIMTIAKRHLRDPARVAIQPEKAAAGSIPRVRQLLYSVTRATKPIVLGRVLDVEDPQCALIFCRTRLEVDTLVETLRAHGHRAQALHGGMQQRERDRVMKAFRNGEADLLVATDVAARGLDIEHLSHVVNYDVPAAAEAYVHRIGRTGRAGRAGTAITLAEPREHRLVRSIEQLTRQKMQVAVAPTVADIRARRLDVTRAALRERLVAADFDDVRVVVESLAAEFSLSDIAAAAVKLVQRSQAGEQDDRDLELPAPTPGKGKPSRPAGKGRPMSRAQMTRLFVGAGRTAGIRPGDLVGAITGEANVGSHLLGAIEIADRYSLVEVPQDMADQIVAALRTSTLRGKRVPVRRDREA